MANTTITCPHCSFSRTIPEEQIPAQTVRIVCPQCNQRFAWRRTSPAETGGPEAEFMTCPTCGERQPQGQSCRGCGAVLDDQAQQTGPVPPGPAPGAPEPQQAARQAPKAGFALRCAAAAIDAVIYLGILLLVISGMSLIVATNGGDNPRALALMWLLVLFVVLAFDYLYRVLFIGYCGQTPGKMTTRIKVIRCNGAEVGYGVAIFREVIGKFISALLLLIGYVMIGFDEQKQGLHDKIADTYVIKL